MSRSIVVEIAIMRPVNDMTRASEMLAATKELVQHIESELPAGAILHVREVRVSE